MIEERYEDLLQRALDGEVTPEESARLRAYLAANAEARGRYDDLENLFRMLSTVEEIEPPAEDRAAVLQRIRAAGPDFEPAARRRAGWFDQAVLALRRRLTPGIGYAFAAGILAGVALFVTFGKDWRPGSVDDSAIQGTLLSARKLAGLEVVDAQQLALPGIQGKVQTKFASGTVVAEIDLESERPLDVVVEFDGSRFSPIAFDQTRTGQARVSVEEGRIRIQHAGKETYVVVFSAIGMSGSDLVIRVVGGDQRVEKTLRTLPKGG